MAYALDLATGRRWRNGAGRVRQLCHRCIHRWNDSSSAGRILRHSILLCEKRYHCRSPSQAEKDPHHMRRYGRSVRARPTWRTFIHRPARRPSFNESTRFDLIHMLRKLFGNKHNQQETRNPETPISRLITPCTQFAGPTFRNNAEHQSHLTTQTLKGRSFVG